MMEKRSAGRRRAPAAVVLALIGLVSLSASGVSQEAGRSGGTVTDLPLSAVQLFSTGLGYFQHDGYVTGDAAVELTFSTDDINDILKSMVLQDFDGGSVRASYPSQDPLARILQSFSINLADNPSFAELLSRARGEQIDIVLAAPAGVAAAPRGAASPGADPAAGPAPPQRVSGTLTGVEFQQRSRDGVSERIAFLTVLTPDGFRSIALSDVESVRFARRSLQEEFDAALAVIAANRHESRKTVTVHFSGAGRRRVRIAYIRAVPVWKTSYRMVLGDDGTAQIQGWALVENTGESDWSSVALSLVSTQPVSFIMDLYTPVYTSRPRVALDTGPSVAPQTYDRGIAPQVARSAPAPMAESAAGIGLRDEFSAPSAQAPIDLSQGVSAAALAEPGAVYRITTPVSIPRRGAAMIPIVQTEVPVERLSVFDRNVLASRALSGVRVTNATGLQLPAGPATVFDGASYAGDVQFPRMVTGESRLVTYAVDLDTTVIVGSDAIPQTITSIVVSSGALRITTESRSVTEYSLSRIADDSRRYVIVHPKRSGWEVLSAVTRDGTGLRPTEQTDAVLRYQVDVSSARDETVTITERQLRSQAVALTTIRDDQIGFYLSHGAIDERTATILRRVRELRARVAETETARREIEQSVAAIYREQERIRANLEVVESGTPLHRRYIDTLTAQEDELERLATRLVRAQADERAARDALTRYLDGL